MKIFRMFYEVEDTNDNFSNNSRMILEHQITPRRTSEALTFSDRCGFYPFLTPIVLHPDGHQKVTANFGDFKILVRFPKK